jgi:hypothetical protein
MSDAPPTFDEQVASLRGKVEPKDCRVLKAEATPEQWAAKLDHQTIRRESDPEKCRAHARKSMKKFCDSNRLAVRERNREWQSQNPEWVRDYGRDYQRNRRRNSVEARLADTLRNQVFVVLRKGRAGSAVRDLGCSAEDLKLHIESQFRPGMTWDNWGNGAGCWSIDHAFPCSQADLTDRVQFLAVANWRNLRPMWHGDNVRKGDAITDSDLERFEVLANFSEVLPSLSGAV